MVVTFVDPKWGGSSIVLNLSFAYARTT